jgi:hypothetical protein
MAPGTTREFRLVSDLVDSMHSNCPIIRNALGGGPPTNVSRLATAVAHKCCTGKPQIVYYHPGPGTESSRVARFLGGAFGNGVEQNIIETYRFICDNYNPGDEVILVGFSRGAFTARSVADLICSIGYLNRAGLEKLPYIFRDYETWQDWHKEGELEEDKHLQAFTLENQDEIRRYEAKKLSSEDQLPGGDVDKKDARDELKQRKQALWTEITQRHSHRVDVPVKGKDGKDTGRMQKGTYANRKGMAAAYRKILEEVSRRCSLPKFCTDAKFSTGWSMARRFLTGKGESYSSPPKEKSRPSVCVDTKHVDNSVCANGTILGVWDTVGSLGLPKMPWERLYHGRSKDEVGLCRGGIGNTRQS